MPDREHSRQLAPTYREFEALQETLREIRADLGRLREDVREEVQTLRKEQQDGHREHEQKMWGLIVAIFLVVLGYLFQQFGGHSITAPTAHTTAAILRYLADLK